MTDIEPTPLEDLRTRLEDARTTLRLRAAEPHAIITEAARLRGKADGIGLAVSYLDEMTRLAPDPVEDAALADVVRAAIAEGHVAVSNGDIMLLNDVAIPSPPATRTLVHRLMDEVVDGG